MLTPRDLRARLARWVPEALKRRLRARLFGYRRAEVDLGFALAEDESGLVVTLDGGLRLRVPVEARDDVLYHFARNGESVEEMHGFLRAAREVGGTLLDVGAARGLFADLFCLVSPSNRAVAFEPSPAMLRDAARIAALNALDGRLELRPAAVGAEPGVVRGSVDVQGLIAFTPDPSASFDVEVTTLDAECARLGVVPTVVKIDVEGHEARVLAGARGMLSSMRPLLFVELHLDLLERRGERPGLVVELLQGHGYRFATSLGRPLSPAALAGSTHAVVRFIARPA